MLTNQDDYLIVNIIENFLGSPKTNKDAETRTQWEFNCPSKTCRGDHNKFNLTYQSHRKIFNCWKCKYRGVVYRLVRDYGSKDDIKRLKLVLPEYSAQSFNVFKRPEIDYDLVTCELPDGYLPLNRHRQSNLYKLAFDYAVNERKLSVAQIDKFKIGYTETGPRKFRIIIPSFNTSGKINYFEARAYLKNSKMPYFKPDAPDKQDIIFNEKFINWDLPVYLVEGVFDAFRIPNSIPMLGKVPSELFMNMLLKNKATVIVCLDSDAFKDGIDIYKTLHSLGLSVFFIDLKGKKDISKIYEDGGQGEIDKLLKTTCKIDTMFEINKLLNE
jgi:hypothetical protein